MPAAAAKRGPGARDALGEIWTEERGSHTVMVRRIPLPPEICAEVEQDVTLAAGLSSQTVLRPIEVGERKGTVQIVYEAVSGRTLRDVLTSLAARNRKLAVSDATHIALELLKALQEAHGHNENGRVSPIVHGRIAPEHVYLTLDGEVRLGGFGLDAAARHIVASRDKVDPAFCYVAPEQCTGAKASAAADLFSLGAVIGEALLGEPLFLGETVQQTFEAIQTRPLQSFRALRAEVPLALDEALAWFLNRDLERRCHRAETALSRMAAFQGMIEAGDRVKPGEHPKRLAELVKLGPAAAALGATTATPIAPEHDFEDDAPIITKVVSMPRIRRPRRYRTVARRLATVAILAVAVGAAASQRHRWAPLARAHLPPALVQRLGLWAPPAAPPAPALRLVVAPVEVAPAAPPAGAQPPPAPEPARASVPAQLSIKTTPRATVKVDGKKLGRTPLKNVELLAGKHTLEFTIPKSKPIKKQVEVKEGERKALTYRLKRR
jgi:hypothetical protein